MNELQEPTIDDVTSDENKEETELTHWSHPTDSTIVWCGSPSHDPGFGNGEEVRGGERTCPICSDLLRRFGAAWWWDTHNRHYESSCHIYQGRSFHNCVGV